MILAKHSILKVAVKNCRGGTRGVSGVEGRVVQGEDGGMRRGKEGRFSDCKITEEKEGRKKKESNRGWKGTAKKQNNGK